MEAHALLIQGQVDLAAFLIALWPALFKMNVVTAFCTRELLSPTGLGLQPTSILTPKTALTSLGGKACISCSHGPPGCLADWLVAGLFQPKKESMSLAQKEKCFAVEGNQKQLAY
eukprot:1155673-Pelagomonas_calceolata.AAC.3